MPGGPELGDQETLHPHEHKKLTVNVATFTSIEKD